MSVESLIRISYPNFDQVGNVPRFVQGGVNQILEIKISDFHKDLNKCEIEYSIVKEDNTFAKGIANSKSESGTMVYINLTGQTLAVSGICKLELSIKYNNNLIKITDLKYFVEENEVMNKIVSKNEDITTQPTSVLNVINEQWFDGNGEPTNDIGVDGNYYLDIVSSDIYKKQLGYWERIGNIRGSQGEPGVDGKDGKNGVTPNLTIGKVTTVPYDVPASITNVGTIENPIFNFNIPQGLIGERGKDFTYEDFTQEQLELLKVKGDKGTTWYDGIGVPPNELGIYQDYYLDISNADIYAKRQYNWERVGSLSPRSYRAEVDYYTRTETDNKLLQKVDKVDGKGLSTNDFTTAEKTKLAGLQNADVTKSYVDTELANKSNIHTHPYKSDTYVPRWSDVTGKPSIPSKTSELTNDSGFATEGFVTNKITEAQLGGEVDLSGYATIDHTHSELHEHSNKDVLDNITTAKVNSWDSKATANHNHDAKYSLIEHRHDASEIDNLPSGGSSTPVVDNLTSTSTTSALSANQGKVLDDKITVLNGKVDNFTLSDENGNKYVLKVDTNGNLFAQSISGIDAYIEGRLLVYEENFNGNSLNENSFSYELGNTRGGRIETSTKENVTIENNKLVITAKKGGNTLGGRPWTSGAIHTCEKQAYLHGRWEAKIKLPNKMGAFPAFWTCGDRMVRDFDVSDTSKSEKFIGVPYPWGGEIDIMEQAPGNWGGLNKTGACFWKATGSSFDDESVSNFSGVFYKDNIDTTEWHIYAMEWTDSYIEIFVDGVSIGKKTIDVGMDYYKEPQFYILNLAMGSGGGNPGIETEMKMLVDWVRIYSPKEIAYIEPIKSISIENISSINVGETKKLSYVISPINVGNRALKWTSSDDSICTAYGGYLVPKKPGNVDVTVETTNGITDTVRIQCIGEDIPCSSMLFNKSETTLKIGTRETLSLSYTPSSTTQTSVSWSSDNESIATVVNGVITPIKNGTCNIKAVNDSNNNIQATCIVNVIEEQGVNVIYENGNEIALTGNGVGVIDTGVKLFDSNKAWTVFIDFTNTSGKQNLGGQLINCMHEAEPYNGLCVKFSGASKHQMDFNGVANFDLDGLGKITEYYSSRSKLVITKESNNNSVKYYLDDTTEHNLNGSTSFGNINETLLVGAWRDAEGNKGRYWKGTVHNVVVYDNVVDEIKLQELLNN